MEVGHNNFVLVNFQLRNTHLRNKIWINKWKQRIEDLFLFGLGFFGVFLVINSS